MFHYSDVIIGIGPGPSRSVQSSILGAATSLRSTNIFTRDHTIKEVLGQKSYEIALGCWYESYVGYSGVIKALLPNVFDRSVVLSFFFVLEETFFSTSYSLPLFS